MYYNSMRAQAIPTGTVHKMPSDLRKSLTADASAVAAWNDITPLARNEWTYWVESAKLADTRGSRIEWTAAKLAEGKRRPCCWPDCMHRQKDVLHRLRYVS